MPYPDISNYDSIFSFCAIFRLISVIIESVE